MVETKTFTSHIYHAFNSKPSEKVNNLCEAFWVGYGDESENCVFKSDSMSVWDLDHFSKVLNFIMLLSISKSERLLFDGRTGEGTRIAVGGWANW